MTAKYRLSMLLFALLFSAGCSEATTQISTTMSAISCQLVGKQHYTTSAPIEVTFILHNNLAAAIKVLTWYTPLEGFLSPLFTIEDEQQIALPYQGRKVKRLAPDAEDFVTIPANGQVTAPINLRDGYALATGRYQVSSLKYLLHYQTLSGEQFQVQCPSQTLSLNIG